VWYFKKYTQIGLDNNQNMREKRKKRKEENERMRP
jgi:hypothetical protein